MKKIVRSTMIIVMTIMLVVAPFCHIIPSGFSTTVEAATTSYYVITTPAGLNVRSGPGTNYKKVGSAIRGGTIVRSSSSKKQNGWLYICEPCTGWVSLEYCKKCESFNDYNNDIRHSVVVSTNGANLNLRSGPSESFGIVTKIPNGTRLSPSFKYNGWYSVSYKGHHGWISSKYTRIK